MMQRLRLLALVLAVTFMAGTAVKLKAQDRDDYCHRQIEKAERNLRKAVERHGEHSPQAEKRRHELEETREHCHHDHDHDHDDHH